MWGPNSFSLSYIINPLEVSDPPIIFISRYWWWSRYLYSFIITYSISILRPNPTFLKRPWIRKNLDFLRKSKLTQYSMYNTKHLKLIALKSLCPSLRDRVRPAQHKLQCLHKYFLWKLLDRQCAKLNLIWILYILSKTINMTWNASFYFWSQENANHNQNKFV